ncbi:TetR/AcrR family transcriptional regulator [Kribbella albertanoniae]|uniref:TetR/AcrR family transcriptional regulator n=1 Tax=Kribbella albertanoniae TaxID=1266829 RepID=UPI00192E18A4|nr:TetR/AcrR family transcriptional regulator [Kribbella albertanoniae]
MSKDRIVAAALRLVDEEGADALSMRTLAQRMNSGTATLYRHFANRAEVIGQVVDHMFGEVELKEDEFAGLAWEQVCEAVARGMFEVLGRHPNAAALLAEEIPVGPHALALRERCIAVLLHSGFPPPKAALTYATLARYVLGFAIQLGTPSSGRDEEVPRKASFHDLDPTRFPATVAVADSLPVALETEFSFGLELLIAGLTQSLAGKLR